MILYTASHVTLTPEDLCDTGWKRFLKLRSVLLGFSGAAIMTALSVTYWWKTRVKPFYHPPHHLCPVSTPLYRVNEELFAKCINEIIEAYEIDVERLEKIRLGIQMEMEQGFNGQSSLKMLPSFVTRLPINVESKLVYSLDIGGTNLRVMKLRLEHNGIISNLITNKYTIPEELMGSNGDELFDFITQCMHESIDPNDGIDILGFTFSFPVRQSSINTGSLVEWTKGFSATGVVGVDVSVLLNNALKKKGIPLSVTALVNDTVGTLMMGAFEAQDDNCVIGLILGTGSNACYFEDDLISGESEADPMEKKTMIINTEWGAFDSPTYTHLVPTKFDLMLDNQSINIGKQHYEKMMSGMYLGELVRLTLKNYQELFDLFPGQFPGSLEAPYSFQTQYMSQISQDTSCDYHGVATVLKTLGIAYSSLETRRIIKETCRVVSRRSARLAAAGVTAIIEHQGRGDIFSLVAIDGSLFELYPGYRTIMEESIRELGYPNVQLRLAKDGSGNGSAITAALVASTAS